MAGILKIPYAKAAKILYLGETGSWKTGSLASLVCAGYKLRIIDTDKGSKILLTLLTDPHFPYAAWIEQQGIDINEALNVVPINLDMAVDKPLVRKPNEDEILIGPQSDKAWKTVGDLLSHWKDGDSDCGRIQSWDDKTILVIDSFSKLARAAFHHNRIRNKRQFLPEEGNMWRQDIGGAQSRLRWLLEVLHDSDRIKCNIIVVTHVTGIDDSRGFIENPGQVAFGDSQREPHVKGFPMAIGRAMAKEIGTFFNDLYIARQVGENSARIYTVPMDEISTKRSVWLEDDYPSSTGLVEIFARHRGDPEPKELVEAIRGKKVTAPKQSELILRRKDTPERPAKLSM